MPFPCVYWCLFSAMASAVSTIYVFARQWFVAANGERVVGPAGLSAYLGSPCGEEGCYAVALVGDNVLNSIVYETMHPYECFSPTCSWKELGAILETRGFMLLFEKMWSDTSSSATVWDRVGGAHYRVLYALQAAATVVYLRVRSGRMPLGHYVVYRLYGIAQKEMWWHASGISYIGTLSHDEADAVCCDDV